MVVLETCAIDPVVRVTEADQVLPQTSLQLQHLMNIHEYMNILTISINTSTKRL
jgi:hypothetical protein